jgi:hypothetical protein
VLLEEYLTALLVQYPNPAVLLTGIQEFKKDYSWETSSFKKIISKLQDFIISNKDFSIKVFATSLPQELLPAFDKSFLMPLPSFNDENYKLEVEKTATELFMLGLRSQIKKITGEMQKLEKDGKEEELSDLQNKLSALLLKLSQKK